MRSIPIWSLMLLLCSVSPQPNAAETETRAGAESSSAEVLMRLLDRINRDRSRHGLATVALDTELSEIASLRCARLIHDRTHGHFSTDGLPPYLRYSMSGVHGYISENVASWSSPRTIPTAAVEGLLIRSHNEMVTEIPPFDGHRRSILDPWATHVGLGYAVSGGELRFVEAFARRYVSWTSEIPAITAAGSPVHLEGVVEKGMELLEISVHWEPLPRPISPEQADAIRSYDFPQRPRFIRNDGGTGNGRFSMKVLLDQGPGIYSLVIHLSPGDERQFEGASVSIIAMPADNRDR
ncbi:MAG: CAP domain-containing protein [Acidobacteria bacterium]|nr:CAP domain-containing protein [Acidobacteriota bacterium]